jgi:thioredoxin-like negative regulator of GroEL
MPKHIDLSAHKALTDLMVDTALLAVWYGLPQSSKAIIDWMRHRSDDALTVRWIDAYRCMRAERYAEAEEILVQLRQLAPQDSCTLALLAALLHETGKPGVLRLLAEFDELADPIDPGAAAIVDDLRQRMSGESPLGRGLPQQQRVTMG